MAKPVVSIVVPTRNRPELLAQLIDVLKPQLESTSGLAELIIVDDAGPSEQAVVPAAYYRLLRSGGSGPARARNLGVAESTGDLVAFTDDDVIVSPDWLKVLLTVFEGAPSMIGFVGPVTTDEGASHLRFHSVSDATGGIGLTCNVAYRRAALVALGGFDEAFLSPSGEDRDLIIRARRYGEVRFVPELKVHHPARPIKLGALVQRGRLIQGDWTLHLRHPDTRPPKWSVRWGPVLRCFRNWGRLAGVEAKKGSLVRSIGLCVVGAMQSTVAFGFATKHWGPALDHIRKMDRERPSLGGKSRIAYIGPTPDSSGGGVAGNAWLTLLSLANCGQSIDCFVVDDPQRQLPPSHPLITIIVIDSFWRWGRWYSRSSVPAYISGQLGLLVGRRRTASVLLAQHRARPYSLIYQFSTLETYGLTKSELGALPLVLHPQVHARGELRALWRERHLALRSRTRGRSLLAVASLLYRSGRQQTSISSAAHVVAISRHFQQDLIADCGLELARSTVIPSAIALERISVGRRSETAKVRVAVVGRIAVRKGIEDIIALSDRLADWHDKVEFLVVGGPSMWSDYRPLLTDLNELTARYLGYLPWEDLIAWLPSCDVFIQAASYEPFGLTVGEALAAGVIVVSADNVGAAENVDPRVCRTYPAGARDELERVVRAAVVDVSGVKAAALRHLARAEAHRLFSAERVGRELLEVFSRQQDAGSDL